MFFIHLWSLMIYTVPKVHYAVEKDIVESILRTYKLFHVSKPRNHS